MPGDPGGLARVDEILGTEMYKTTFTASPMVFGAFPSLHSACACQLAFFTVFAFGPRSMPVALVYVLWIWWAAMYLRHHYMVDLVGGAGYAIVAFWIGASFLPPTGRGLGQKRQPTEFYVKGRRYYRQPWLAGPLSQEEVVGGRTTPQQVDGGVQISVSNNDGGEDRPRVEQEFKDDDEETREPQDRVDRVTRSVIVSGIPFEEDEDEDGEEEVLSELYADNVGDGRDDDDDVATTLDWNGWRGYESWLAVISSLYSAGSYVSSDNSSASLDRY
jgi:hypothetical protein